MFAFRLPADAVVMTVVSGLPSPQGRGAMQGCEVPAAGSLLRAHRGCVGAGLGRAALAAGSPAAARVGVSLPAGISLYCW